MVVASLEESHTHIFAYEELFSELGQARSLTFSSSLVVVRVQRVFTYVHPSKIYIYAHSVPNESSCELSVSQCLSE